MWQLGPQDDIGRWVHIPRSLIAAEANAKMAHFGESLSFHIGGVYGYEEIQQYVLGILNIYESSINAQAERIAELEAALREIAVSRGWKREDWRNALSILLNKSSQGIDTSSTGE